MKIEIINCPELLASRVMKLFPGTGIRKNKLKIIRLRSRSKDKITADRMVSQTFRCSLEKVAHFPTNKFMEFQTFFWTICSYESNTIRCSFVGENVSNSISLINLLLFFAFFQVLNAANIIIARLAHDKSFTFYSGDKKTRRPLLYFLDHNLHTPNTDDLSGIHANVYTSNGFTRIKHLQSHDIGVIYTDDKRDIDELLKHINDRILFVKLIELFGILQ